MSKTKKLSGIIICIVMLLMTFSLCLTASAENATITLMYYNFAEGKFEQYGEPIVAATGTTAAVALTTAHSELKDKLATEKSFFGLGEDIEVKAFSTVATDIKQWKSGTFSKIDTRKTRIADGDVYVADVQLTIPQGKAVTYANYANDDIISEQNINGTFALISGATLEECHYEYKVAAQQVTYPTKVDDRYKKVDYEVYAGKSENLDECEKLESNLYDANDATGTKTYDNIDDYEKYTNLKIVVTETEKELEYQLKVYFKKANGETAGTSTGYISVNTFKENDIVNIESENISGRQPFALKNYYDAPLANITGLESCCIDKVVYGTDITKDSVVVDGKITLDLTEENLEKYLDASKTYIVLTVTTKAMPLTYKVVYADDTSTLQYTSATAIHSTNGYNDTYKTLLTVTMPYKSEGYKIPELVSEDELEKIKESAPEGWSISNSSLTTAKPGQAGETTVVAVEYEQKEIRIYIDYGYTDGDGNEKIESLADKIYPGDDLLYEGNGNNASGKIYGKMDNAFANESEGDFEYIGYEVYYAESTDGSYPDESELKSGINPDGTSLAKADTVVVVKVIWQSDSEYILKIYGESRLAIALDKKLKLHYWDTKGVPCKRKNVSMVSDPDTNYVALYWPGIETVNEGLENEKKVFTLTAKTTLKTALEFEERRGLYNGILKAIKNLLGISGETTTAEVS